MTASIFWNVASTMPLEDTHVHVFKFFAVNIATRVAAYGRTSETGEK
jgi:hypothetical protein